jgi:hypothetical protein
MTFDIWSFLTFLGLVCLAILITLYNGRMTAAIRSIQRVAEDWYIQLVKDRRQKARRELKVAEPKAWLSDQLGMGMQITDLSSSLQKPFLLNFHSDDHSRVVVSPLPPEELRRALRSMQQGRHNRIGEFMEPVLGRSPWRNRVIERSVLNGGEWFDVEAGMVGRSFELDWGEPERLWFHIVPLSNKKK